MSVKSVKQMSIDGGGVVGGGGGKGGGEGVVIRLGKCGIFRGSTTLARKP